MFEIGDYVMVNTEPTGRSAFSGNKHVVQGMCGFVVDINSYSSNMHVYFPKFEYGHSLNHISDFIKRNSSVLFEVYPDIDIDIENKYSGYVLEERFLDKVCSFDEYVLMHTKNDEEFEKYCDTFEISNLINFLSVG